MNIKSQNKSKGVITIEIYDYECFMIRDYISGSIESMKNNNEQGQDAIDVVEELNNILYPLADDFDSECIRTLYNL